MDVVGRHFSMASGLKVRCRSDGWSVEINKRIRRLGQQKTLMLVRPESKKVLREAVRSDADFLAKMNIMDYS